MKCRFRFLFILLPIAFISLGALVTMGLWNWLMPLMFGLGTLTFIQAAGILILARILFGWKGGHHFGWHGHRRFAHAGSTCGPYVNNRKDWMHHRWQNHTPEQQEKFAGRCGYPPKEEKEPQL